MRCWSRIRELLSEEAVFRAQNDQVAFEESTQIHQLSLWRDRVAQWYYNVADHMNVPREVVYLAMNFLDRSTALESMNKPVTKDEYELTSTTCIFLAMRVSSNRPDIKISDLLQASQSQLQVSDIQAAGARLLKKLSLKTPMVNPSTFAKAYLHLLEQNTAPEGSFSLLETSVYLIELSVCDHYLERVPASKLAFAAVAACVTCAHTNPTIEAKTQDAFLRSLEDETGLSLCSPDIRRYFERLVAIYNQSHEGIALALPALIEDDSSLITSPTPTIPQASTESSNRLLPWAPSVYNLSAFDQVRPTKRVKLCR